MDYKFFREIQPERGIQSNFASGQINYKWETSPNTAWVPSQSYLKIKINLKTNAGDALEYSDDVALNMMACDQLFQQINMRVNGVLVSELNDYVATVAALKCRLAHDMNRRQSLLSDINYTKIDMKDRQAQVASNGVQNKDCVWDKGSILAANAASGATLTFMDLATPHRVEFIAATDRVVFSRNNSDESVPDMSKYFSVGDYIYLNDGAEIATTIVGYHTTVSHNDSLEVAVVNNNVGAANLVAQVRIHDRYFVDKKYSKSVQNDQFELIWTPPLGFFDIDTEVSGQFQLELTPNPNGVWQRYAIESSKRNRIPDDDYKIEITEANFYLWQHVHPQPINDTQTFIYSDIRCTSQNLTTKSLTSKGFQIHPNNHSLTVAWQDSAAGDDTRYSRAKFKIAHDQELLIKKFYIQMDGITLPEPIPTLALDSNSGINELYQRYVENFHYSGAFRSQMTKFETMEEWKRAGIFFHFKWGTGYKKSGQALVYSNFDSSESIHFTTEDDNTQRNPQILLFDHYYHTITMTVKNGELIEIEKK